MSEKIKLNVVAFCVGSILTQSLGSMPHPMQNGETLVVGTQEIKGVKPLGWDNRRHKWLLTSFNKEQYKEYCAITIADKGVVIVEIDDTVTKLITDGGSNDTEL